jgi:hypothetical protein
MYQDFLSNQSYLDGNAQQLSAARVLAGNG